MEISINGIKYEPTPTPENKQGHGLSAYVGAVLMMYGGMHGMFGNNTNKAKHLPTRDIVGEFKLIQEKKSNLSRAERELVVREFNKHFRIKTA